ncbi:hydroxyacid dehydrogenase [Virgibacillus alimentarius]|uniref:D-3-phosphoglycerate dehydrogenase/(S)-sulfolactate dehydrogenase n=1 Tax=Virgibacillus alimentarius TaxID=698769 RepID=A0ABS4S7E5_9BACI|nr:hydroxyacid dehydrogenase [Virgibacillus alimentarius]MBP2257406.1 D-3-phosphoglycerate dehydrogenase/(S)-sulfolactate dehydrogenase [Virgibacillus alimentarius]
MKVLVTELMWDDGMKELKRSGCSVDYDMELGRKRKELLALAPAYDALIVRNETKVDAELLDVAKNAKVIGRLGVGLDNIDLGAASSRNIPVITAKHANATSVAEYVMASMLDAYRPLHHADADVRRGNWNRKFFTGNELNGKTLGLVGMGEIAHRVARRANAFGMETIGYDPFVTPFDHILAETGVRSVNTLDELLVASDFVSVHVPLTKETRHMINKKNFPHMKPHAYVINAARGGIIHEGDLIEAVQSGEIAGAYLDVLEAEPIPKDSPLTQIASIRLTPHIAGATNAAQSRTAMLIAEEVMKVLNGGQSLCAVV